MRQILNPVFLSLTLVSAAGAQEPSIRPLDAVSADIAVREALKYLDGLSAQSGVRLAALAAIRSPLGQEHRRAAAVAVGNPAIGLGGSRGGRRGYPDEWADIPAMARTAKHLLLTAVATGNARRTDK